MVSWNNPPLGRSSQPKNCTGRETSGMLGTRKRDLAERKPSADMWRRLSKLCTDMPTHRTFLVSISIVTGKVTDMILQ